MKKRFALVALPLAFAGLGACSTYGYGYGYDDYGYDAGYGYDDGYGYGYGYGGPSVSGSLIWSNAYYDSFYGPVYGGYWAPDGYFWYQSRLNGPYIRDHGRHFRRDYFHGGKEYRYQDNRHHNNGGWNGRDRDRNNTYPPLFSGQQNDRDWNRNDDRGGRRDRDDRNDRSSNASNAPRSNPPPSQPRGQRNDRDRNSPPPLFSGQQQSPRANPPPQQSRGGQPQLDGAPRGGDRGDRGGRGRGDGRSSQGGRSQAAPSPPPAPAAAPPPSQPKSQPSSPPPRSRSNNDGKVQGRGGEGRRPH